VLTVSQWCWSVPWATDFTWCSQKVHSSMMLGSPVLSKRAGVIHGYIIDVVRHRVKEHLKRKRVRTSVCIEVEGKKCLLVYFQQRWTVIDVTNPYDK